MFDFCFRSRIAKSVTLTLIPTNADKGLHAAPFPSEADVEDGDFHHVYVFLLERNAPFFPLLKYKQI